MAGDPRYRRSGFDPVSIALEWARGLDLTKLADVQELVQLETSEWAELHAHGEQKEEAFRQAAGRELERLAGELVDDPNRAAVVSQLLAALDGLTGTLRQIVHDPRFQELPAELRAGARAFAARTLIRGALLEADTGVTPLDDA